jgi:hypothetical protein
MVGHFSQVQRLQEESDSIRWQVVSRQATLNFSDSAAQRLLDIQGQIGQASGSLPLAFYRFLFTDMLSVRQLALYRHWEPVSALVFYLALHEVHSSSILTDAKYLIQLVGDMWCMYAAWWLFLIGLTVTGGLGMAGSGMDEVNKRPSQSEWTARRWTVLGIVVCALCVVGGFIALCWSFHILLDTN